MDEKKFEDVDFIIDDGSVNLKKEINNSKLDIKDNKVDLSSILKDRNGEPPPIEVLQEIQNRLMGRPENFSKLSNDEKEKIIFKEIEDYHFSKMPKIEELEKEFKDNFVSYNVDSLNKENLVGLGNPHINIKAQNVKLSVLSDGKTIVFNNKELLEEYRKNINNKNNEDKKQNKIQEFGETAHNDRVFK